MTEKAFRLDFVIAISALLVSAVSAIALIYQTRVIGDQFSATIWPYISGDATTGPDGLSYRIINNGLGPALLQSAQLVVDGKPVRGWDDYLNAILQDPPTRAYFKERQKEALAGTPGIGSISTDSIGPGTTIRPGDGLTMMKIDMPDLPIVAIHRHAVGVRLCYCSLNRSCWTLDTTAPGAGTKQVPSCGTSFTIQAAFLRSPSTPKAKK